MTTKHKSTRSQGNPQGIKNIYAFIEHAESANQVERGLLENLEPIDWLIAPACKGKRSNNWIATLFDVAHKLSRLIAGIY